jgi:hypothetical protein
MRHSCSTRRRLRNSALPDISLDSGRGTGAVRAARSRLIRDPPTARSIQRRPPARLRSPCGLDTKPGKSMRCKSSLRGGRERCQRLIAAPRRGLTFPTASPGASPQQSIEEATMANPAPVGSDVSAGTYRCANCGYELSVQSTQSLPPCPECSGPYGWEEVSGGDSAKDPYPNQDRG